MEQLDVQLFMALAIEAERRVGKVNPQECANTAWALATPEQPTQHGRQQRWTWAGEVTALSMHEPPAQARQLTTQIGVWPSSWSCFSRTVHTKGTCTTSTSLLPGCLLAG